MIAVLFEAWPSAEGSSQYFDIAAMLRPELDAVDGFISIERFSSLADPAKILSLSFWRDEEAVGRWRANKQHRSAQTKGRQGILDDYRLRVAFVIRDYGKRDRGQAPEDNRLIHDCG